MLLAAYRRAGSAIGRKTGEGGFGFQFRASGMAVSLWGGLVCCSGLGTAGAAVRFQAAGRDFATAGRAAVHGRVFDVGIMSGLAAGVGTRAVVLRITVVVIAGLAVRVGPGAVGVVAGAVGTVAVLLAVYGRGAVVVVWTAWAVVVHISEAASLILVFKGRFPVWFYRLAAACPWT